MGLEFVHLLAKSGALVSMLGSQNGEDLVPGNLEENLGVIGETMLFGSALAWIDDLLTTEAFEWAKARLAPTLLVPIDPSTGLQREAVDELLRWAQTIA